jgi:uncharacterized membrane protein YgcG
MQWGAFLSLPGRGQGEGAGVPPSDSNPPHPSRRYHVDTGGTTSPRRGEEETLSPSGPSQGALHLLLLPLLLSVVLAFGGGNATAEEAITRFASDIVLDSDGTLHVEETIRVRAEGDQIRRGIFRDVSTTLEDAGGNVRRVGFELVGVTRNGEAEPYFTENYGDYVRIYAGEESVFLPTGEHTYVLTYETDRQVRWFEGKPELYWNVTGNEWAFPIDAATVNVRLPDGVAPVQWTAYTGRFGERGADFRGTVAANGELAVRTARRLAPSEGLTVVVEIPAGAVAAPSASDNLRYFFLDYREWIIGILGFIAVLAYYLFAWNAVGRDPKGGTIIPLFHPPKGVSPPLASYIRNWGFGANAWKAFTAAALSLAVRGLLVFDQEGKDLTLERTEAKADGAALSPGEKTVLDWVEARGGRAEINKANGTAVASIGQKFQTSVKGESGGRHFRRNILYSVLGLAMTVAVVVLIVAFGGLSEAEIGLLGSMFFAGIFLAMFMGPLVLSVFQGRSAGSLIGSLASVVVMFAFLVYFGASFLSGIVGGAGTLTSSLATAVRANSFPFALVLAFPLLNGLFFYLLRAPTPEGRPVMDELEGFRMYMETAESGRLNIADAPEITTGRFEALLPYAVALDVEKPWANAFATALARAHPGDADPMSHYRPRWRRGGSWPGTNLGSAIASSVTSATSAMRSSLPRSSSSSSGFSGGSSGGGGGGRGGGGW